MQILNTVSLPTWRYLFCVVALALSPLGVQGAQAQVQGPDSQAIFIEESKQGKKAQKAISSGIVAEDEARSEDVEIEAATVEVIQGTSKLHAKGGAIVSGHAIRAQSDEAIVDQKTKDAEFRGNVLMSGEFGRLKAKKAAVNLDTELGKFSDATVEADVGGYRITTPEARRVSEFTYEFGPCEFSTCDCPQEQELPWSLTAEKSDLTEEGYAHLEDAWFRIAGKKALYFPYLTVPAKRERASGLLPIMPGYSNRDGFQLWVPLYGVISDSADVTLTPFIESRSRVGAYFDYRQDFSLLSSIRSRFLFSDESMRNGDLRGVVLPDPANPGQFLDTSSSIPKNRSGISYQQRWQNAPDAEVPMQFIADVNYVSDDLLLRELEESRMGQRTATYTVSSVALRTSPIDSLLVELGGEYNQIIDPSRTGEDKGVFQRAPSLGVSTFQSFRPFGQNPLGVKTVFSGGLTGTNFVRSQGYEGTRYDFTPQMTVPFRFSNVLSNQFSVGYRYTGYELSGADAVVTPRPDPATPDITPPPRRMDDDRAILQWGARTSTALEKVYSLSDGSFLQRVASLGKVSRDEKLVRIKHVIEPTIEYKYVEDVDQRYLPTFDALDRIQPRDIVIFGLSNTLYGRFDGRRKSDQIIESLGSELDDTPVLGGDLFVDPVAMDYGGLRQFSMTRRKAQRQIAALDMTRGYRLGFPEDRDNPNRERLGVENDRWTDLNTSFSLYPTSQFGVQIANGYNFAESDITQWSVGTSVFSDRGDAVRMRYLFADSAGRAGDPSVDQIEGNIELRLSSYVRLGYYGRFDARPRQNQFIEQMGALRFTNDCDCWSVDVGFRERANPDRQVFTVQFNLLGLGGLQQRLLGRN